MNTTNVWIVRGENCFSSNGEVGWIEGVYATEALAEEAAAELRIAARDVDGMRVYELLAEAEAAGELDEDGKPVDASRWDVSIMVERHEVEGAE